MSEIFLHIGPHKTGSTYIQKNLYEQVGEDEETVVYPKDLIGPQYGHHKIVALLMENQLNDIQNLLSKHFSQGKNIILSSENFDRLSLESLEKFSRILKDHAVKTIYYVRNPTDLIVSSWQEEVKHGLSESFYEYIEPILIRPFLSKLVNHRKVLDIYADIFGKNSITLISYDDTKIHGNIFDAFCKEVGLDKFCGQASEELINKSLPLDEIEIIRVLNIMAKNEGIKPLDKVRNAYLSLKKDGVIRSEVTELKYAINLSLKEFTLHQSFSIDQVIKSFNEHYSFKSNGECLTSKIHFIPQAEWIFSNKSIGEISSIYKKIKIILLST